MVNRLKAAVSEYREASKVVEDVEEEDDFPDFTTSEGSEGSGEDDEMDYDQDDMLDMFDEEEDGFEDDFSEEEAYTDDFAIAPTSRADCARVDDEWEDPFLFAPISAAAATAASGSAHTSLDLLWLKDLGFSETDSLAALARVAGRAREDALAYLYSQVLGGDPVGSSIPDPLDLYNVDEDTMLAQRLEEAMALESICGNRFEERQAFWLVSDVMVRIPTRLAREIGVADQSILNIQVALASRQYAVCQYFLEGKCRFGSACKKSHDASKQDAARSAPYSEVRGQIEFHFPSRCRYPYETPLIIFRSKLLPQSLQIALSLGAQDAARRWIGEGHGYAIIEWFQGEDARALLEDPPDEYFMLLEHQRSTDQGSGGGGQPPRHCRIKPGVRVIFVLKQDQGTGRTSEGIVSEVLTRGDHPRGVKVRCVDGRVGRVQQLISPKAAASKTRVASADSLDRSRSSNAIPSRREDAGVEDIRSRTRQMAIGAEGAANSTSRGRGTSLTSERPMILSIGNKRIGDLPEEPLALEVAKAFSHRAAKRRLSDAELDKQSSVLFEAFQKQQKSHAYVKMQEQRQKLPAWTLRQKILETVNSNRVIVISGETGCGKTTQVPQFIYDDHVMARRGGRCKILVTQPRRISAIGVAERVASERGERLGKNAVGYHIRMESKMCDDTRILFCTTGILLRRLEEGGPEGGIDDISHIIVDEVHERSLDSDFVLMVLKDLLVARPDLTLVLMSATLNAKLFSNYFGPSTPTVHIPGRTFPVKVLFLEEALAKTGYRPEGPEFARRGGPRPISVTAGSNNINRGRAERSQGPSPPMQEHISTPDEELDIVALQKRYKSIPESAVKALSSMDTEKIQYPLIEQLVVWMSGELLGWQGLSSRTSGGGRVGQGGGWSRGAMRGVRGRGASDRGPRRTHGQGGSAHADRFADETPPRSEQRPNRAILIFMPGFAEISALHELMLRNGPIRAATKNGRYCFALHSTLSSEEQMRGRLIFVTFFSQETEILETVFQNPEDGAVKIVIATNVAETSITIDDVVYVVDCGRMKETRFDPATGMASLEECWVSRANAMQRRGRAGRVSEGTCVHLFTSHKFEHHLLAQQPPEIHRTPLEQVCLRIKTLPFLRGRIAEVLRKVIEPPSNEAVQAAIITLRVLRALTREESLTPLGFHLGRLPVDVRLILFGSIFHCLDPVLTIAAGLSIKSPFVAPFDKRELADEKKRAFSGSLSDHLTLLNAYQAWQRERCRGYAAERKFIYDNFLSGKTLTMIASVKRQLAELLSDIGFVAGNLRSRDMERAGGLQSDGVADAIGEGPGSQVSRTDNLELVKSCLVAALYPNVIKIESPSGKPARPEDLRLEIKGGEQVFVHPSSVNWKTSSYPSPFLVYHEKVRTSKVYIRDSTCVNPYALCFFGGKLTWDKNQRLLNLDDGWIRFGAVGKVALVLEASRLAFDELLAAKIADPKIDVSKAGLIEAIVQLVTKH
ncbi:ATPdependent RNA helicase [Borealophlyctis nickersoniae]|nr:ATPdependent RNA helicase [Borealophlyctis nickersoniae]